MMWCSDKHYSAHTTAKHEGVSELLFINILESFRLCADVTSWSFLYAGLSVNILKHLSE